MGDFQDRFLQDLPEDPESEICWEGSPLIYDVVKQIISLRLERGWSYDELARRAGISQNEMEQIEYGENITLEHLIKIADVFGKKLKVEFVSKEE